MFRLLFAAALALMYGIAAAQSGRSAPERTSLIDRIVAVVNSEVITQFDLTERVTRARRELRSRGIPEPDQNELQRQVLERMIVERVQLQLARETGLQIDDLQLDATIARIAESNNMPLTEFRRTLERDAVPFDKFREEVRVEVVLSRLREREVDNRISVAESEIDNFIVDQKEAKNPSVEYKLSHIVILVPEQARPEQIAQQRSRADEAVRRVKAGADFAQVAAAYSDARDALEGGNMDWRTQDRLPELYAGAAAGLRTGEISEVLRSPAGFHILRLNERRGAGAPYMVEQNHVRHILVRTSESVSQDEATRKLLALRERIVNGSNFAELARLNSDDASAGRGGDLGWIYPGDTVPDFERAMKELKPLEVSKPVKTQFGWHLIQVLERRTTDASSDRKRLEARKALRERKSDEAFQEWLRQLRDRAWVEYRIEER
ncbi:MAG: molecular chaperone SurA [Betaproteobacteria bacterium RIFCSPLOWO2_12_FULL_65_110]|nr:MAG: molecular chaperone SurA [Betaproteobacteria bacterium RIFCSPLOWO2_12_FULL_65_110]